MACALRDKVFFFVDNRNVIGKDIPFQFVYQRRYGQPLFSKNVVLAHDVDALITMLEFGSALKPDINMRRDVVATRTRARTQ